MAFFGTERVHRVRKKRAEFDALPSSCCKTNLRLFQYVKVVCEGVSRMPFVGYSLFAGISFQRFLECFRKNFMKRLTTSIILIVIFL